MDGRQQHYPQFLRSFKWLMTGSGTGTLASSIRYATAGYTSSYVKNFITRAGASATAVDCAVGDPSNSCWSNTDSANCCAPWPCCNPARPRWA